MNDSMQFDPRRSRWIPWVFVGGMLLVVVVNGGLVYAALSSFTGLTTGRAFDRGRTYNQVIQEAARQEALGWQARVTFQAGVVSVSVVDRDGQPVSGGMEGYLQRPLDGTQVPLAFRQTGAGRFESPAVPPQLGQWEARLLLRGAGGDVFEIRQRLIVS
ncbi:FixH family protein [Falsiroseomonas sp.]|uniref:FixH family protein n=1 Tax=Falsiroseomonas sp. TaxID=2870721 RepID=UPI00272648E0|nr:FixH family protein [Falsiroseomonas sp.]MDO9499437.1 FixH family protein [Falsiroseomonas sp.]